MNTNKCALCNGTTFHFMFDHHYGWSMQQCKTCGLVQVMPRPSVEQIARLYHEDMEHFTPYIEQLSVHRQYFRKKILEIRDRLTESRIKNYELRKKIQKNLDSKFLLLNSKLLDVGCAMGVLLSEAKKVGFVAEGVDISKDAIFYCKKHGMKAYAGTLTTFKGGTLQGYDVVTAFEVIEHEQDPLGMARRAHQLLKKDGLFVLGTPDHAGWWRVVMGNHWFGYSHPEHIVLFDPMTITKLLKKARFTDIEVKRDQPRKFPLYFVFTRGADYFPWMRWLLVPIGNLIKRLHLVNPVNPWDDMIVFARK